MKHTERVTDPAAPENFVETTTGDDPSSSVEVSFNAKGVAQLSVKYYYPGPRELIDNAGMDVWSALYEVAHELAARGIQVAGIAPGAGEEAPE